MSNIGGKKVRAVLPRFCRSGMLPFLSNRPVVFSGLVLGRDFAGHPIPKSLVPVNHASFSEPLCRRGCPQHPILADFRRECLTRHYDPGTFASPRQPWLSIVHLNSSAVCLLRIAMLSKRHSAPFPECFAERILPDR